MKTVLIIFAVVFTCAAAFGGEGDPPAVTLHLQKVSPRQAFDEFEKQTGIAIRIDHSRTYENPGDDQKPPEQVSVDIDNKPFWPALNELCAATRFALAGSEADETISLRFNPQQRPAILGTMSMSVSPSATFIAESIRNNASVDLSEANPKVMRDRGMEFAVNVDPRLHVLHHMRLPTIETAVDERGASVTSPAGFDDLSMVTSQSISMLNFFIPLEYDNSKSHKLASFKGALHVQVATKMESFAIDKLPEAAGDEKNIAGMRFRVADFTEADKQSTLTIDLDRNDASRQQWERAFDVFPGNVTLTNVDGEACYINRNGTRDENHARFTFRCEDEKAAKKPLKFVWRVPLEIEERDLPFEFHDLVLP